MIIASHIIFSAYGFWLPNDPRGSWSEFVRSWELLLAAGKATTIDERRSVAGSSHDPEVRYAGKRALQHLPVRFDGHQAVSIAAGFAEAIAESNYSIYACAILPDHAHLVAARHARDPKQIAGHLKARATQALTADQRHPFHDVVPAPSPWARKSWTVFLDTHADVGRAIRYVEENPVKMGFRPQRWPFVIGFAH
jgi:REP element-mobilizing transposase RayT